MMRSIRVFPPKVHVLFQRRSLITFIISALFALAKPFYDGL
jgi:hypothetical protein